MKSATVLAPFLRMNCAIICVFLLLKSAILGGKMLSKVPIYDVSAVHENIKEHDPFLVNINTKASFNHWLNDTNYISTFYSVIYAYNSSQFGDDNDIVIKELELFSRYMLDSSYNVISRACIENEEDDEEEDEHEIGAELTAENNKQVLDEYSVDEILSCQEDIKLLTYIVDVADLDIPHEMLEGSNQRLLIFPPSMRLSDYHKNKNALLRSFELYDSDFYDEDDISSGNNEDYVTENPDRDYLLQLFVNQSKFSIFNTEYRTEEITFFEYENLSLRHMLENYPDWKFQMWDFLAKVLSIYISIPKTMQEQTNQFLYYFTIFFIALIFTKKKVIPFFNRGNNRNTSVKIACMFFSFLIIMSSITGYQFVKSNAIILLARDNDTEELVYFAGSFNWQFGIETLIISVLYIILGVLVMVIIKKSRAEASGDSDETPEIAAVRLISVLLVLYIITYLSQNVLTQSIFRAVKYNGNYAY